MNNQSPTSWSSGESLVWFRAVEGYCKSKLTKRMLVAIKAMNEPNLNEINSLIRRGADLEAEDEYGMTSLDWAIQKHRDDVVDLILKWKKPGPKGRFVTGTNVTWGGK